MTTRQQWAIVGGVVALLAIALTVGTRTMGDALTPVVVGSKAPKFAAQTLDGDTTKTLADYQGKVVLLNVWATWCLPCAVEMPGIQKLHEEFGPKGLRIVAVSVDEAGSASTIRQFVEKHKLTFEILHDGGATIQRAYQMTGVPESFLIGQDGVIRQKQFVFNWYSDASRAVVAQLLGLEAPTPLDTATRSPGQ